jgi:hypothetical protein
MNIKQLLEPPFKPLCGGLVGDLTRTENMTDIKYIGYTGAKQIQLINSLLEIICCRFKNQGKIVRLDTSRDDLDNEENEGTLLPFVFEEIKKNKEGEEIYTEDYVTLTDDNILRIIDDALKTYLLH